jgi:hypothetical protein
MTQDFGTGVSRVLDPSQRSINQVIWQQGKPPTDAELNFIQQMAEDWRATLLMRDVPSGWLGNEISSQDVYVTNSIWSNWFRFGQQRTGENRAIQWAVVNGWLIPVTGTGTGTPPGSPNDTDTWNKITLDPPPSNSGDSRTDFIFLEAWVAKVAPDPSTTNKPAASSIYRYGNVEGGYTYLTDDLQDPALGFETTQRVQVQYRIRVVTNMGGLSTYPDGFNPTYVKGRGTASSDTTFTFSNMRTELGDPGLWRAGDGTSNSLGTVDGYTYAIPLAVVFRRNSVAWDGDPGSNLNGGYNRNPTAVDRTGAATFSTTPTLASDIDDSATTLVLVSATDIPMPVSPATSVLIQVDDEIMSYSVISGTNVTVTRAQQGSIAEPHKAGAVITVLSGRPDGLYSDQVAKTDIFDLRHVVNPNGFDYETLLRRNLDAVLRGDSYANWKRSGAGPQGSFVFYQDKIGTAAATGITLLDSADNIRTIFSDAACLQRVEVALQGTGSPGPAADASKDWDLKITALNTASNEVTIPISQFQGTLGSDTDQVRFATEITGGIEIRLSDSETPMTQGVDYTVAPATPTYGEDLVITFAGAIPANTLPLNVANNPVANVSFHVMYGPGRGLSRRPDAVHSVSYLNPDAVVLCQNQNVPSNNVPQRVAWAPVWSAYTNINFNGNMLPTAAESFIDPGSKTIICTPFRRVGAFGYYWNAFDGSAVNPAGVGNQSVMPADTPSGAAKWTLTDPLELFGILGGSPTYTIVPRNLMPYRGAFRVPILNAATSEFYAGINFGVKATTLATDTQTNYLATALFSTWDFGSSVPLTYNTKLVWASKNFAGMRQYTEDKLAEDRQGLELPPFYGIARLIGVYEAQDYETNHGTSTQTNLLRQNFDGDTFWVETDIDGDPTFILNAEVIDLERSPNPIADFASGNYVIEAVIFGTDRGSFTPGSTCRLVLRPGHTGSVSQNDTDAPDLIVPGPLPYGEEVAINYSRNPYQGDAWGSQTSQLDVGRQVGPLLTSTIWQVTSNSLDEDNLTRPNQKPLEVLASVGFMTTLGTGRLAGQVSSTDNNFTQVGWEDYSNPSSAVTPRPKVEPEATDSTERTSVVLGTAYHGCTSRLPLGALFRDKDFRCGFTCGPNSDAGFPRQPLMFLKDETPGVSTDGGTQRTSVREQSELTLNISTTSSGQPGEVVVHVDGEQGNYALLTNFRTNRGGSAFVASGPYPGGILETNYIKAGNSNTKGAVLSGVAYLVRNAPTNVGAVEVSAGSELMMLVATRARRLPSIVTTLQVSLGTNGYAEGYAAADLYRVEGHPLVRDNVRLDVDPTTIELVRNPFANI